MSKNIEIIIGMKFYPFLVLKGTLLKITDKSLKASFDKKHRTDLTRYFPKPVMIRYKDENSKIITLGEGNLIELNESENNIIILEISIDSHSVIKPNSMESLKKMMI